jgi:sporulation integral membrane protein YlbJ
MRKLLFLLAIVFMTICMLLFPEAAYQGASNGIRTWVVHLLPSLLPFFIVANLLFSLGFVRFLGVLLEPIMRPVFRLPGEAGFALALGFTSGFPMGAILTTSLCEQNLCTDEEAARLAAFTNNSSPLFLLTAVPVSMLHAPELGILLLSAHYAANLTIGILLRFTACKTQFIHSQPDDHLLRNAFTQLLQYQKEHTTSIGTILGQAIQKGITSIVQIGGFVLFFSVLLAMLDASDILTLLETPFAVLLGILQITPQLSNALASGFFEMTLGAQSASQCNTDILEQLMIISFILGWSGLSIQAQVCSILSSQHISPVRYCLCRPLQGILAAAYIPLFICLFPQILNSAVFSDFIDTHATFFTQSIFFYVPIITLSILAILLFLSICISQLRRILQ